MASRITSIRMHIAKNMHKFIGLRPLAEEKSPLVNHLKPSELDGEGFLKPVSLRLDFSPLCPDVNNLPSPLFWLKLAHPALLTDKSASSLPADFYF